MPRNGNMLFLEILIASALLNYTERLFLKQSFNIITLGGLPEKWDPGPRTLQLGPFTWNPGPIGRTQNLYMGPRTWDPPTGLFTWDPGPYMWEPGPNTFTYNAGPILRNPYINTALS